MPDGKCSPDTDCPWTCREGKRAQNLAEVLHNSNHNTVVKHRFVPFVTHLSLLAFMAGFSRKSFLHFSQVTERGLVANKEPYPLSGVPHSGYSTTSLTSQMEVLRLGSTAWTAQLRFILNPKNLSPRIRLCHAAPHLWPSTPPPHPWGPKI